MTDSALGSDVDSGTRTIEIGGLAFDYDDRVLEPRPWTVAQSAWGAGLLSSLPQRPVLELCSGAGHIGLLAVRDHDRRLVQVDVDPVACGFARLNAGRAGLADRVDIRCGAMDVVVLPHERFPLVIADPPWVPSGSVGDYPEDPLVAIDGGPQGLDVALRCIDVASRVLTPAGACLLQVGTAEQVAALATYVGQHGDLHLTVAESREFERGHVVRLDRA